MAVLPVVLYMALIFYLSSRSRPIPVQLPDGFDKVLHFAGYAFLGLFIALAMKGQQKRRIIIFGWIIATIYGITDEIHQSFVPGRESSIYDLLADSTGALTGLLVSLKLIDLSLKKKHP